jgi:hypothetical protein
VRRFGTPPSAGTTNTSVLPSYCAEKAISFPSGENAGRASMPSSVVSRRTSVPSSFATHRSSAYTNATCVPLVAGWASRRVSRVLGSVDTVAGAMSAANSMSRASRASRMTVGLQIEPRVRQKGDAGRFLRTA